MGCRFGMDAFEWHNHRLGLDGIGNFAIALVIIPFPIDPYRDPFVTDIIVFKRT